MPELNTMMYLSFLLLGGLCCGRLVKHIKLPNVTGYLLAGLLMGPCVLKLIPKETVESFNLISQMALAFMQARGPPASPSCPVPQTMLPCTP